MKNNKHKNNKEHQEITGQTKTMVLKLTRENLFESGILSFMPQSTYYKGTHPMISQEIQVCITRDHPDGTVSFMLAGINALTGDIHRCMIEFSLERDLLRDLLKQFDAKPFEDKKALEKLLYDAASHQRAMNYDFPPEFLEGLHILSYSKEELSEANLIAPFQRGAGTANPTSPITDHLKEILGSDVDKLSIQTLDEAVVVSNVPLSKQSAKAIITHLKENISNSKKTKDEKMQPEPGRKYDVDEDANKVDSASDSGGVSEPKAPYFSAAKRSLNKEQYPQRSGSNMDNHEKKGTNQEDPTFENPSSDKQVPKEAPQSEQPQGLPPEMPESVQPQSISEADRLLSEADKLIKMVEQLAEMAHSKGQHIDVEPLLNILQSKMDSLNLPKIPIYDPTYCKDWDLNDWAAFLDQERNMDNPECLLLPEQYQPLLFLFKNAWVNVMRPDKFIMKELDYLAEHPVLTMDFPNCAYDYPLDPNDLIVLARIHSDYNNANSVTEKQLACKKLTRLLEQQPNNPYFADLLHHLYWNMGDKTNGYRLACRLYNSGIDRQVAVSKYLMEIINNKKSKLTWEFLKKSTLFERHVPQPLKCYNEKNYYHYYLTLARYFAESNKWPELIKLVDIFNYNLSTHKNPVLKKLWQSFYTEAVGFMHESLIYLKDNTPIKQILLDYIRDGFKKP